MVSGRPVSGARAAVPAEQIQELAPGLRPVREEMRLGLRPVRQPFGRYGVAASAELHLLGGDPVGSHRVQAEDLRAQLRRDLRVAVLLAQFRRDLEGAERLDLVLRRAVPNRIRAPEHVVRTNVLQELAEPMRGLRRVAHQEAPGAAELRVDVRPGAESAFLERADQRIDAVGGRAVWLLLDLGHEPRVINEEADVREALCDRADVAALAVLIGLRPERQALVHADDLDAETSRLLDEADADVVVQVEAASIRSPLRVALPGADAELVPQPRHVLDVARLVG